MFDYLLFASALIITFLLTFLISRRLIPALKSRKMGQKILDIGPRWHKSKEGTPIMGGVAFIFASLIASALGIAAVGLYEGWEVAAPFIIVFTYALLNGLIGCIDDLAKLKKAQNEGLTARQKYLLQVIAAALFLCAMAYFCSLSTTLYIPFIGMTIELGVWYYVIAMILLTGIVNSVNLTDGIDGLASSVTLIVGVFFAASAFLKGPVNTPLSLASAVLIGSVAGFLIYNFYPAKVFMGDTGSLFLGGLVVGGAFLMNSPLIIVIAGIVYIAECASVILQVSYFKLTHGKRLFKMSPLHHHFEKSGWSEIKIVAVFSVITALACIAAYFLG